MLKFELLLARLIEQRALDWGELRNVFLVIWDFAKKSSTTDAPWVKWWLFAFIFMREAIFKMSLYLDSGETCSVHPFIQFFRKSTIRQARFSFQLSLGSFFCMLNPLELMLCLHIVTRRWYRGGSQTFWLNFWNESEASFLGDHITKPISQVHFSVHKVQALKWLMSLSRRLESWFYEQCGVRR